MVAPGPITSFFFLLSNLKSCVSMNETADLDDLAFDRS